MDNIVSNIICDSQEMDDFTKRRLKVRRRLVFEDEDTCKKSPKHSHLNYEDNIKNLIKQKSQKWNFDFEQGTPLNGAFEWVEVNKYNLESVTNRILSVHASREKHKKKNAIKETNENFKKKFKHGKIKMQKFKQTVLKGLSFVNLKFKFFMILFLLF